MAFAEDYKDVPTRIRDFKALYPDGCLRPADLDHPYRIETLGDRTWIVVVAAAYRTPDDPCPGIGMAYEPFPGKTNFTKDSELQNAETSAWGRAIVAVLASESKSVASAEDVRNRVADQKVPDSPCVSLDNAAALIDKCKQAGVDVHEVVKLGTQGRTTNATEVFKSEVKAIKEAFDSLAPAAA